MTQKGRGTRQVLGEDALNLPDPDLVTIVDTSPSWRYTFLLASAAGFDTSGRVDSLATARGVPYNALAMGSPEGYDAAVTTTRRICPVCCCWWWRVHRR